ncbi:MAG TPA: RNA methyltransferase, partial [Caldithrix sp.]|nr:RNA methyltransferase [Caldithrix sp.]
IGTILRTANWFGVDLLLVSGDSVDLFNPKVVRSSMGSLFHLQFSGTDNLAKTIKELQQRNFTVISSTPQAETSVHSLQVKPPLAFILGSEAHGVSPEIQQLATITVSIPRHGEAESLNVAVAGGILMYHFSSIIYSEKSKHGRKYPDNLPAEKSPERGKK